MELSAGRTVLYDQYMGIVLTLNDEKLVIITESEVLVIVGSEKA